MVITAPANATLQIQLTNNLSFGGASIPTSIVIAGQLGGGLGTPIKKDSPAHDNQGTTWPIANGGPDPRPPAQGQRVQSFGQEIAGGATSTPHVVRPQARNLPAGIRNTPVHPGHHGPDRRPGCDRAGAPGVSSCRRHAQR